MRRRTGAGSAPSTPGAGRAFRGFSTSGAENSSKSQRKFDCIAAPATSDVVDAAAHDELGAGHECGVRRQEEDRDSDFFGSADALQRDLRRNVILEALDLLLRQT